MKVKIQAGAELDTISPEEMRKELELFGKSWFSEISKGDRYKRISASVQADSSGDFALGGSSALGGYLGPAEGFIWSVKRLMLAEPFDDTTQTANLYINDASPASQVRTFTDAYLPFTSDSLVLMPGETLLVTSVNVTASTYYTLTGQVHEMPLSLLWRL